MKKVFVVLLCALFFIFPSPVFADQNNEVVNVDFIELKGEASDFIIRELELSSGKKDVLFSNDGAYYLNDNGNKVMVIEVVDSGIAYDTGLYSATMNTFKRDFEVVRTDNSKAFKLSEELSNAVLETVENAIATMVTTLIHLPIEAQPVVKYGIKRVAQAIIDYPPSYTIRINQTFYRNKMCIQYLSGSTFKTIANGAVSDLMYEYRWSENPSLGVVGGSCKTASITYPYATGIGR